MKKPHYENSITSRLSSEERSINTRLWWCHLRLLWVSLTVHCVGPQPAWSVVGPPGGRSHCQGPRCHRRPLVATFPRGGQGTRC